VSEQVRPAALNRLGEQLEKTSLGFWLYLMTDCVLFGALFATYFVVKSNTFGGPGPSQLFHPSTVLIETLALLLSSYACGLAVLRARKGEKVLALFWLAVTFALGAVFLGIELT
jgi:cytochrome o ubiquinol oxidase subunit 3